MLCGFTSNLTGYVEAGPDVWCLSLQLLAVAFHWSKYNTGHILLRLQYALGAGKEICCDKASAKNVIFSASNYNYYNRTRVVVPYRSSVFKTCSTSTKLFDGLWF